MISSLLDVKSANPLFRWPEEEVPFTRVDSLTSGQQQYADTHQLEHIKLLWFVLESWQSYNTRLYGSFILSRRLRECEC